MLRNLNNFVSLNGQGFILHNRWKMHPTNRSIVVLFFSFSRFGTSAMSLAVTAVTPSTETRSTCAQRTWSKIGPGTTTRPRSTGFWTHPHIFTAVKFSALKLSGLLHTGPKLKLENGPFISSCGRPQKAKKAISISADIYNFTGLLSYRE